MGKRGSVGSQAKRTKGVAAAVDAGSFPAPDYLSPTALEYWTATVAAFPVGHFTDSDRVLLEQYCEAAATHRNAGLIIQKDGRKYRDDKGVWRRNLAVDDAHQARCDCAMLATKLRITKTSMISPKSAGRAAQDATDTNRANDGFGGLLFGGSEARQ